MTIEKIEKLSGKTIFHVLEPMPYGELDKQYTIEMDHSPDNLSQLPKITREEINNLPNDRHNEEKAEEYEITGVGTVVFVNSYDTDYGDVRRYRQGGHTVKGPYLLVKEEKEIPFSLCGE